MGGRSSLSIERKVVRVSPIKVVSKGKSYVYGAINLKLPYQWIGRRVTVVVIPEE